MFAENYTATPPVFSGLELEAWSLKLAA